jgi:phospholipase C
MCGVRRRWGTLLALLTACGGDDDTAPPAEAGVAGDGTCSGRLFADASREPSVCPSPIANDQLAASRASCAFHAGDMPKATLGLSAEEQLAIPIRHVIVLMKENRSYDEYFGQLPISGQPAAEAVPPTFVNLDNAAVAVNPYHEATTCVPYDPGHSWEGLHFAVNGGKMDGFVVNAANSTGSDGHFAMGYYDATDLPFYYFLANTFALADRYFPSVLSGTHPNRDYLVLATSDGVACTGCGFPALSVPSLMDLLEKKCLSWAAYTDYADPFESALGPDWHKAHAANVRTIPELLTALADGTLPAVSFVDSLQCVEDEHPTADVQVGEKWTRDIYQAVVSSPLWPSTALIWVYDEAGGFADHVPPPHACPPAPSQAEFFELGVRVPMVVVSPWARRHYVSHVVHEHTAITRFIETVFDLPALTARDANSDALLDMFDFSCPNDAPIPPAPPAGTGGCR